MRRHPNEDCPACFLKGCDCECATCIAARERNYILSETELIALNLKSKEYLNDLIEEYLNDKKNT